MLKRDLKGLIQGTVQTDPVIRELTNAVAAFTDAHLLPNKSNKARKEEVLEDKTIECMLPGLKFTKLCNLVQVPNDKDVENASPRLYFKLANKKNNKTRLSILQQDCNDFGAQLKIKAPLIPLGAVVAVLAL